MNKATDDFQQPHAPLDEGVVFHVHGVTKVYQMGEVQVHALRGVDLDLYGGEFTVLLGASGSGKSTLLNILGGLDIPTDGHVLYGDRDLTRASEAAHKGCQSTLFPNIDSGISYRPRPMM